MKRKKIINRKLFTVLQILFVFLLTVGVTGYFSNMGIEPRHDGIMLKPASDIAHGQMLFRDTFTQYGALSAILQSWAINIFGNYLIVIKLFTVFVYGLIAVMLWLVWALFLPEFLATLACVVWLFQAPYHDPGYHFLAWPSVYALFFQLLTMYSLLKFLKSKGLLWSIVAGISTSLIFWSRQPVGFFLIGSIVVFILIARFKKYKLPSLKPFFVSYLGTHSLFFIWLIANNALVDWYYQTVQLPGVWATGASPEKAVLLMNFVLNMLPFSYSPISIWTLLPLITLILGYTSLNRKRLDLPSILLLLITCMNLASWLQYHPVNDPRHLFWGATPMIGFAFYFALNITKDKKKSFLYLFICLLLFLPDMFQHVRLARRKIRMYASYPILTKPAILKGIKVSPQDKKFIDESQSALEIFKKKYPKSFVITTGPDALYPLFDGGNRNCYNLTVDWKWGIYLPQIERKYTKAMQECITRYKPAIFSPDIIILPQGYVNVTKTQPWTGNYLLLPQ